MYNLAARMLVKGKDSCSVQLLDLQLPDTTEGMLCYRSPRVTESIMTVHGRVPDDITVGCDYMLVGAKVTADMRDESLSLEWPQLSKGTGHIMLPCETHQICGVAELFCGGMAAWSQACKHLPVNVSLSLDRKMLAIQSLQINELLQHEQNPYQASLEHCVCGDVGDFRSLSKLSTEEGFMASPPCQGFSNLGKGLGLDSKVADAWEAFFKVLRFGQRRFLLLENVVGLLKHRDFQEIRKMLQWCGYTIVHQRVCDASSMGCTSRLRLMIVAWNTAEWNSQMHFMSALPCDTNPPAKPIACSVAGSLWRCMPASMRRVLLLNETEVTALALRQNLPPCQRVSTKSVWELRTIQTTAPMPSITSSYYTCTTMPKEHVKAKGLYVPVLDIEEFRRLSKWEILHSLGMPMTMCVPWDEQDAISLLGESFPPMHALCPLILALANRPEDRWSKDRVDATFWDVSGALSPSPFNWDEMCEVEFGCWARLVPTAHAERGEQSLTTAILHYRTFLKGSTILSSLMKPTCLSRDPPSEQSAFEEEQCLDAMQAIAFRPGFGCITLPVCVLGQEPDDNDVLKGALRVWCLDEPIVVVQRVGDSLELRYVVDEVVGANVYKRIVLLEGLPARAMWVNVPLRAKEVAEAVGLPGCAFKCSVNHGPPRALFEDIQDGDLVRLLEEPCDDHDRPQVPLNPLSVWPKAWHFHAAPTFQDPETQSFVPPTLSFQVTLPGSEGNRPASEERDVSEYGFCPGDHPCSSAPKRKWQQGGLKGGAKPRIPDAKGWWLQVGDKDPLLLDLLNLQGRTLRQEREGLGLMCLDTTVYGISLLTKEGVMFATWSFKFPFTARDTARDTAILFIQEASFDLKHVMEHTTCRINALMTAKEAITLCPRVACNVGLPHGARIAHGSGLGLLHDVQSTLHQAQGTGPALCLDQPSDVPVQQPWGTSLPLRICSARCLHQPGNAESLQARGTGTACNVASSLVVHQAKGTGPAPHSVGSCHFGDCQIRGTGQASCQGRPGDGAASLAQISGLATCYDCPGVVFHQALNKAPTICRECPSLAYHVQGAGSACQDQPGDVVAQQVQDTGSRRFSGMPRSA